MNQTALWANAAELPVRRLTGADRRSCMDLAVDREWGPEEFKWRFLFDVGEVYGIEDPAGGLVGCYVLTRYENSTVGTEVAAIGMVLVASRFNGRGLGRRLMTHAIEIAGDATVVLHATEMGRPLYEKLGFKRIDMNSTHVGTFTGTRPGVPATRLVTPADLAAVHAYDRAAFGLDRAAQLTSLHGRAEQFRVVERDGRIVGFAAAWRNRFLIIGPIVADDLDIATALITDIAAADGGLVRIDVLHSRPGLRDWAIAHGVPARLDGTYMTLDGKDLPGDPARVFAPITQAV